MLKHLYIENVTIIKKIFIDFAEGLNVMVGQTGSGKSVILDCIELVTGGRSKSEMVRKNENKAVIVAHFENCNNVDLIAILNGHSIETNGTILIKRIIYADGKSNCFINDMPVSLSLINKISGYLIEINGQFVQGRLLDQNEHLKMLDEYADLRDDLLVLKQLFVNYDHSLKEYNKLLETKDKISENYDYNCTIVSDLDKLQLIEDEENKLLSQKKSFIEQNSNLKILEETINIENEFHIIKNIKKIAKNINNCKNDATEEFIKNVVIIEQSAIEFCEGLDYIANIVRKTGNTEYELEIIEDRLYQIRQVCRRYNVSSVGLTNLYENAKKNIDNTDNIDINLSTLKQKTKDLWNIYLNAAQNISDKRFIASRVLINELHTELSRLKMEHAKMDVVINTDEKSANSVGINLVYFAASTNPGMPIMPIHKIASGGELSRFMLAFKAVMSRKVKLPAMIFDEIDSGTSGIVASLIGDYLVDLSTTSQVIAVTHSHQVVKRGNIVLKISKKTDGIETNVNIENLDEISVIKEIEVMISGIEN